MKQARGYCRSCKEKVLLQQPGTNHILHLLLSLITVGIWIPIWILAALKPGGWRCSQCGRRVMRNALL